MTCGILLSRTVLPTARARAVVSTNEWTPKKINVEKSEKNHPPEMIDIKTIDFVKKHAGRNQLHPFSDMQSVKEWMRLNFEVII